MKINLSNITETCHHMIGLQVEKGDICIDATAGNGHDTLFLAKLAGENGKVYAFDIQEEALKETRRKLEEAKLVERVSLIQAGHEDMDMYVSLCEHGKVSCAMFNLGYLPGGDHNCGTKLETSLEALAKALSLLRKNGMISLCIYSGGDTGFAERDGILAWLKTLDSKKYLVLLLEYYNRPNHPPLPVFIYKL